MKFLKIIALSLFCIFLDAQAYDFVSDNLCFNIISNTKNTVEVTYAKQYNWNGSEYYVYSYGAEVINIPSMVSHNGEFYKVIGIGEHAFSTEIGNDWGDKYRFTLKKVLIPDGIEYIGYCAFRGCEGLDQLCLPSSIKSIGEGALAICRNLKTIFMSGFNPPSIVNGRLLYHNGCEIVVPQKSQYMQESSWAQYESQIIEVVTFNDDSLTYNGYAQEIPYISNLSSFNVSVAGNTTLENFSSGVVNISIQCQKSQETVINSTFDYVYNIQKAPLSVIINNQDRIFGEPNPDFTYKIEGFINNEDENVIIEHPNITTIATPTSDVGVYDIVGTGGIANNYKFSFTNGKLTVAKASLQIQVDSISREYGDADPTFTLSYQGLKNGENEPVWIEKPIFNTMATIMSPVGEYAITATAAPKNYDLTYISDGVLTIQPAKLKVVPISKSKLYYEDNPELTFRYNGFKNGENETVVIQSPVLTTDAKLESNVGEYQIAISGGEVPNYEIEYHQGTLTIRPRVLSVQTGTYARFYGERNPTFELEYNGFVNSEDITILETVPVAYTKATENSNVGTYPIYITGGEALNYTFNYSMGQISIVKADQEIIWNQDLSDLAVGQQVEMLAYSTSGLPVTYNLDSNNICEIYSVGNKKYLDCIGEGEIQIRASQNGNENYNSSPRVSKKISVNGSSNEPPILIIKQLPVGSISTSVNWGSILTFKVGSESGWKINTISVNGVDYTNKIDNNSLFTTPSITQNTTIIISYIDLNSGIEEISMPAVKIIGCVDGVKVVGANENSDIIIYSVDGFVIKNVKATNDEMFFPLSANNTYIVRVNGITAKIRI